MRRSRWSLAATLALLAGAGCAGWGETETVRLEWGPLAADLAREASIARLESGGGVVRVRRAFRVPDACRRLEGTVARAGVRLSLRVAAVPTADACAAAEGYLAYTAEIEGLPPGLYELRVVHGYPRAGRRPEVVLEHPVRVRGPGLRLPRLPSERSPEPWN